MNKITAAITAVGGYVPETKLTNADLEKMVETNDEWIRTRTGISERRILKEPGKASSDLGTGAVMDIIRKKNLDPKEIDCIICATVTPDMMFPATANIISHNVGASNAFGFDLNAACSGFLFALTTGTSFIESGRYKKVIVVGADKMSSIVDYTDRTTCVLFGDAAGAVLLEPSTDENGILDSLLKSDGVGKNYLYQRAGGSLKPASVETVLAKEHFIFQDGQPVFKYAVKGMADVSAELLERNNLTGNDIAWLVPHQANLRIIDATANRMGLTKEKVMINIQKYGNTTAATIPLCLWEWENQLHKGDKIVLAAFGGGFTWGATLVKWAYN
ncbi:MAG: ketoacyl-ACP synthase III [Bacteroidetes bacterium]|nr:ketoacyl-ACP synthase III [Bacteroidota bacterium]MBS1670473.1 ketoacyl-ACP synthase III [Bacteroidota bacterium]